MPKKWHCYEKTRAWSLAFPSILLLLFVSQLWWHFDDITCTGRSSINGKCTTRLANAILEKEIWQDVENDSPDKDMHLASPTAHLKTEFQVASPGYPHGILEYVTKTHNGEKAVTESFHHIIAATKCNGLVLDIGANTGFYSMLTLSEGCKHVVSFDPQPSCVRHIEHALVKNDFKHGAIVPRPVDYVSGRTLELNPKYDCAGRWPVLQHEGKAPDPADLIKVETVTLTETLPYNSYISLAKVDTEGAEYRVLLAMMPFVERNMVENIIFEITPMWWTPIHGLEDRQGVIDQFVSLVRDHGFSCRPLEIFPWAANDFYTKENVTGLAKRIDSAVQVDFWFCKEKSCW